jgi:hypothetical protein
MVRSRINNSEGRSENEENLGGSNKLSSSSLFTGALFIEPFLQPTDRNVPVLNLDGKNISILLTGASRSMAVFSSKVGVANLEQYPSRRPVATFVFI